MSYSPEHPLSLLDASGEVALEAAYNAMRRSYSGRISTLHLLLGLLEDESNEACKELQRNGIDTQQLKTQALTIITSDGELATSEKRFTPAAKRALERAKNEANEYEALYINPIHLLLALLPQEPTLQENITFGKNLEDGVIRVFDPLAIPQLRQIILSHQGARLGAPKSYRTRSLLLIPMFCLCYLNLSQLSSAALPSKPDYASWFVRFSVANIFGTVLAACALVHSRQHKKFQPVFLLTGIIALCSGVLAVFCLSR